MCTEFHILLLVCFSQTKHTVLATEPVTDPNYTLYALELLVIKTVESMIFNEWHLIQLKLISLLVSSSKLGTDAVFTLYFVNYNYGPAAARGQVETFGQMRPNL